MAFQNPFGSELAARRYAAGRLDVHAEFARRIVGGLGGRRPSRTLDIGCGTGLSTCALAALGPVVGIDVSVPMLREAARSRLRLVRGRAESLPFPAASFDLVTMGSAFHWCEPGPLGAEVRRVLAAGGHLAVFDHCLLGRMQGEPRFTAWFEAYKTRFVRPPRHPAFDATREGGFVPVAHERFEHNLTQSLDALVGYVTSQSNVLAAVAAGTVSMDDAEAEVRTALAPLFGGGTAPISYRGDLDLLRKR